MKEKIGMICFTILICFLFVFSIVEANKKQNILATSANVQYVNNSSELSNKKIGWGIKRAKDHMQPDLGSYNQSIIDQYKGICMGNKEKKYVYLTFDEGYEAGYTDKILEVLKQNQVTATFFITAHYLNTQPDLVKKMIDYGQIVGNHTPNYLMSGRNIITKC